MRNDAIAAAQTANDAASYEQHTALFKDIATVLRKNIVQAAKVRQLEDGTDIYRASPVYPVPGLKLMLRQMSISERKLNWATTSLSSHHLPSLPGAANASNAAPAEEHPSSPPSTKRMSYSALKRAHTQRIVPELKEEDLEESFVRGSGPGGQSINKTENNVQLLHKPTGIRVSCQETRSLSQNRKIARKRLLEKLDKLANPGLSKEEMKLAKKRERERQRRKKAKKKALAKEVNAEVEER
ncbi:peptide chain release factor 1 [Coprinopsis cinerea AmutBmut pab1-1]|nr:peptide chain release factor 1 [Coprinopsis cinerea AmutBmut pab1-1]